MLAAIKRGNPKKLVEAMRQDPGFKMNMVQDECGKRKCLLVLDRGGEKKSSVLLLLPTLLLFP